MASNKTGMKNASGSSSSGLGGALLTIVAVGVAGGAALIGGAKVLGETLLKKQESDSKKAEALREADKEEARRIMKSETGEDF